MTEPARDEPRRPRSSEFSPGQAAGARRAIALVRHRFALDAEGTAVVLAEINGSPNPDQAFADLLDGLTHVAATFAVAAYDTAADATLARFANGLAQHEHNLITGDDDDD